MDMETLLKEKSSSGTFRVLIKPNSPRTEILNYSEPEDYFKIAVSAPPRENRANLELVKFLTRLLGRKVRIKSGHSGKRKVIELV